MVAAGGSVVAIGGGEAASTAPFIGVDDSASACRLHVWERGPLPHPALSPPPTYISRTEGHIPVPLPGEALLLCALIHKEVTPLPESLPPCRNPPPIEGSFRRSPT